MKAKECKRCEDRKETIVLQGKEIRNLTIENTKLKNRLALIKAQADLTFM